MTGFTFDDAIISDLHKDARGYRPYSDFYTQWHESSNEEKQAIWDGLMQELDYTMKLEREVEEQALADFEASVATFKRFAGDYQTALRWMTQNEHFAHIQDVESWVWGHGILFTDRGRELVRDLMKLYELE